MNLSQQIADIKSLKESLPAFRDVADCHAAIKRDRTRGEDIAVRLNNERQVVYCKSWLINRGISPSQKQRKHNGLGNSTRA